MKWWVLIHCCITEKNGINHLFGIEKLKWLLWSTSLSIVSLILLGNSVQTGIGPSILKKEVVAKYWFLGEYYKQLGTTFVSKCPYCIVKSCKYRSHLRYRLTSLRGKNVFFHYFATLTFKIIIFFKETEQSPLFTSSTRPNKEQTSIKL